MGASFAGIVRAPMTSVVMIFETTRDYAVIVPLMISNLVSFNKLEGIVALQDVLKFYGVRRAKHGRLSAR